jgi:1-Cys peroxiredoxin 6
MSPTIGDTFPDLRGETQDTDNFSLYEYLGSNSWGIVFMHPGDFTPVCTTELGAAQSLKVEFDSRNTKLCGFSCDDATKHRAWIADIEAATGQRIDFPLFCDPNRVHSIELGIFDPQLSDEAGLPLTVRSVFILNPKKEIALTMTYPVSVGRNFDELLRVLDALQRASNFGVATPANWQPGDRTIVSYDMDDEKADEKFGKNSYIVAELPSEQGQDIKKHYLRYVDDPILTDTKSKQSSKLVSRIGKVKSWKPPKSFLPLSSIRKRVSIGNGKNQSDEGPGIITGADMKKGSHVRQSNVDYSQNKPWQSILKGFSNLKSETVEQQGNINSRRNTSPTSPGTGTELICGFQDRSSFTESRNIELGGLFNQEKLKMNQR